MPVLALLRPEAEQPLRSPVYVAAMERLVGVVQALSFARDLNSIMAIVRDAARDLTGADGASFVLRDGDKCYYADESAIGPLWKGQRFPMSICVSGWVMQNARSIVIPDIYLDPRVPADAYRPTFVKSLVMVPIRSAAPIGAIGSYWARTRQPTEEEVTILQSLADTTSVAMENVQLYEGLQNKIRNVTTLNSALAQQNAELERFAYICSHDMHEPVRMMNSYSMLLQEASAGQLDEMGDKYLRFVRQNAERLQAMIEQILNFSRVGREEIASETIDCNRLVAGVLDDFEPTIQESGARIECGELPVMTASPLLLRTLFHNLIGNALKFRQAGRTPQISIDVAEAQTAGSPAWRFSVRDNGIGIDEQFRDKVFAMFQRIHLKEEYPGTAIGLSICKKFIELCGGSIDFESRPGEGTAFFFTLPQR
jgi:signal transduction histidine kinase